MTTFYSEQELAGLGLKQYGNHVLISRNALLYTPELLEIGHDVRIDDFVTISGRVTLKSYIHISHFVNLYGGTAGITMEDFSAISAKGIVYATSNDYSGESMTNPMVPQRYKTTDLNAPVHLGRHVVVGCMSVILPGVTIGDGCSVGAMSLCKKDLAPWGIYAGCPAVRIKERSRRLLELEADFLAGEARADGL